MIRAPLGMSYVNAFYALWRKSKSPEFLRLHPEWLKRSEKNVATADKIASLFQQKVSHSRDTVFLDYEGGRIILTCFDFFPLLDVERYDAIFGAHAAIHALNEYHRIPPAQRIDKDDRYRFSELLLLK